MSAKEIDAFYRLADEHHVGVVPMDSPSQGPSEWSLNGGLMATRRFLRDARKTYGAQVTPQKKREPVRWTDKNRWE
jgi:hypothetical protein